MNRNHFCSLFGILLLVLPWLLHGFSWPEVVAGQLGHCPKQNCDFLNHYLPQAQRIAQNISDLQDGWFYPPTLAIVLEPLLFFSESTISTIWTCFNVIVMLGICVLGVQTLPNKNNALLWSLALVSTSMPVLSSIKWGQISLLIVFLCWWSLSNLHQNKHEGLSGIAIGMASALKGFPAVYLLWPLWKKNIQSILFFVGSFLGIGLLLPLLRIGWEQTKTHYVNMLHAGQWIQHIAPRWGGQALSPSMHRWFVVGDHMMDESPALLLSIPDMLYPVIFLSTVLGMSFLVLRRLSTHPLPVVLLFCWLGLLFSPGWQHYFGFLPLCMLSLWHRTSSRGKVGIVVAATIERIPILLLGSVSHIYYDASAYGTTTIATILILLVALLDVACHPPAEHVE